MYSSQGSEVRGQVTWSPDLVCWCQCVWCCPPGGAAVLQRDGGGGAQPAAGAEPPAAACPEGGGVGGREGRDPHRHAGHWFLNELWPLHQSDWYKTKTTSCLFYICLLFWRRLFNLFHCIYLWLLFSPCAIFSSSARVNFIVAVALVVATTPDIYSFYLLSPVEFSMLIYFHFAKTLCLKWMKRSTDVCLMQSGVENVAPLTEAAGCSEQRRELRPLAHWTAGWPSPWWWVDVTAAPVYVMNEGVFFLTLQKLYLQ